MLHFREAARSLVINGNNDLPKRLITQERGEPVLFGSKYCLSTFGSIIRAGTLNTHLVFLAWV